jgi:hypothetical protein
MKRWLPILLGSVGTPLVAFANDWGMGESNAKIAPPAIFTPVSTPALEISTIAYFVITVCARGRADRLQHNPLSRAPR